MKKSAYARRILPSSCNIEYRGKNDGREVAVLRNDEERPLTAEEQEFFRRLYRDHYGALFAYTYQLGIGRDAAEDYVQDAFMTAIRRIEAIKASDNPRGYLYQVLKNVIGYGLRSLRYAVKLQRKLEAHPAVAEPYAQPLGPETLYRGSVSDGELELLIRFYLEGWSQRELARELGISENACQKRIARAKAHLREAIREVPGTPEEGRQERG